MLCFTLYLRANSKYKPPQGAYIQRGDLTEGFLLYEFGGLFFGGAKGLFSQFYCISGWSRNAPPQFKKIVRSVG